jgi:hypothetical protein
LRISQSPATPIILQCSLAKAQQQTYFLTIQPVFYFLGMSAAQTFYSFGKLGEPFADIRKGSLFNGYYFHTSNFKWFIKRVDSIFIGK